MKKSIWFAPISVIGLALYLSFWPVPVNPVVWESPVDQGYTGGFAVNDRLADLETISLGEEIGPEHIAPGPDGFLYVTVASGRILRMKPDGTDLRTFAETGGRVLGFDFDRHGHLIAADAEKGLLSIDSTGMVKTLTDRTEDGQILLADAVVVASDGRMYFTDASKRFGAKEWGGVFEASVLDILEQSATGRVLVFDPIKLTTEVIAGGISFANGIAISKDERSLFVAETGKYRIWKLPVAAREIDLRGIDLKDNPSGATILIENLPGYPDNLMKGRDGRIWVGLVKPRNPQVDAMAGSPFLRTMTLRLPRFLWPVPPAYGHVVAFSEDGLILADLQDPSGAYPETTAVTETEERLYIQSLNASVLGWLPRSRVADLLEKE